MEIINIEDMELQEAKRRVSQFSHDGFFHYLVINNSDIRLMLCQKMVKEADLESTEIMNGELYGEFKDKKKVVLDILAKDCQGRYYNLEMQCYGITSSEFARFQTYGFRVVTSQAMNGEPYSRIKGVRQMVINASSPIAGLDDYYYRFTLSDAKKGAEMPNGLYEMHLVQLAHLDMEKDADDFNQLMYLFKNGREYDKIEADRKIKEAVIMHDEYMKSEEVIAAIQRERDRLYEETRLYDARVEGLAEGRSIGLVEGETIGEEKAKKEMVIKLLAKKKIAVSKEVEERILNCSIEAADKISENIFEIENEEDVIKLLDK